MLIKGRTMGGEYDFSSHRNQQARFAILIRQAVAQGGKTSGPRDPGELVLQVDVVDRLADVRAQSLLNLLRQCRCGARYLDELRYGCLQGACLASLKVLLPGRIIDGKFAQDGAFTFRCLVSEPNHLRRLVVVKRGVLLQGNGDQNIRHLHALELVGRNHHAQ